MRQLSRGVHMCVQCVGTRVYISGGAVCRFAIGGSLARQQHSFQHKHVDCGSSYRCAVGRDVLAP